MGVPEIWQMSSLLNPSIINTQMQFQRALFRLHERCLSCKDCGAPLLALATLSYLLFIYFAFLLFLSADFLNNPHPLFEAVQSQLTSNVNPITNHRFNFNISVPSAPAPVDIITNDTATDLDAFRTPDFIPYNIRPEDLIYIHILDLQPYNMTEFLEVNALLQTLETGSSDYFHALHKVELLLSSYRDYLWKSHVYSAQYTSLRLSNEIILTHNITKHYVFLRKAEVLGPQNIDKLKSMLDMDAVMINMLAFTFRGWEGFMKNELTHETWNWNQGDYDLYAPRGQHSYLRLIVFKICRLVSIFFGFWLLSTLVALSLRVFLFCASVIIFPIYFCCPQEFHFSQLLRAMPWFGFYAAYYGRSGRSTGCLVCSLLSYFLFFYIVFNVLGQTIVVKFLLCKSYPHQFVDLYLISILIPEFVSFLFIRTRTSLKYFSKIVMCLHLMLLIFVRSQFYAFSLQATGMLIGIQGIMIALFLNIQRKALTVWDQFSIYAPSTSNPRCGYQLVSPQHFHIHLPLWTMFKSIRFRHTFKEEEKQCFDQLREDELLLRYNFDDFNPNAARNNIRRREVQLVEINDRILQSLARDEPPSQPEMQV